MAIPQAFIQDLLARADVVEIVGRSVQLKKSGANFVGLCPFHAEKSASFTVSPAKQFYHCFGCGKNGDAIRFLMENGGLNFVEATKELAGQYGMELPEDDALPADRERAAKQREKQATLSDVLEKAGEAYRKLLKNSPRAIAYLKGRGLSGEIAKRFGLGYAPEGWRGLASVFPDYGDPLLEESGLIIANAEEDKRYDRFRDRIMFPIRSVKGECIGFGGRVLGDEKPKYLNSPETPVFSKGRELYGLFEARSDLRERGFVLVTEGYMDVVALAQLGFPNAVATLGTACTSEHVHKLVRFTDAIVFSFDGDEAGRRAARKALDVAIPFATDVRSVKFLFLPAEHDPDSYIREFGSDAFSRYVSEATPLSRFLIDSARDGCDLSQAEGRARMAANARPLWSALPEGALKRQVLNEIAALVGEDGRELLAAWTRDVKLKPMAPKAPESRPWTRKFPTRPSIEAHARNAARLLLASSGWWDQLSMSDHEVLCGLEGECGELFKWLDTQAHEHGAQPLAALLVGAQGLSFEATVGQLVDLETMQPTGRVVEDPQLPFAELQRLVRSIRLAVLDLELKQVYALPSTDPERVRRETELIKEQFALKREHVKLLKSP